MIQIRHVRVLVWLSCVLSGSALAHAKPVSVYAGTIGNEPVELVLIHDHQRDAISGHLFDQAAKVGGRLAAHATGRRIRLHHDDNNRRGTGRKCGPVDFDEMVAGARAGMARPKGAPLFVAFASLSMPDEALAQMIADTTRAGGVVVFRGFSTGNPQTFISGIRKVVDQSGASNVAIDPRLFRSFGVDRVPTYVALATDFEPCDQLDCVTTPPPHDRISGNTSVAYVLETFAGANGPGAPVARLALANLRGKR